ncbi:guanylate kinase [Micromonospora sp. NPDC049559]|uniref:guanylate kinase n=1 Tax=Micromonospora sp. NPDC049559 TaxID=3155923 RepID=UPI00342CE1E0
MHGGTRPAARLTVLTGPSGAGQRGVVELVRARSPLLWVSVPVTTRPRREHEADGVHYRFVEPVEFARLVDADGLLEWSELGGHRYGTCRETVGERLRAGRPVLVCVDLAGARRVRRAVPEAQLVFLAPPGVTPSAAQARDVDVTLTNDQLGRTAEELVGLLGSSFLTPARPPDSG